MNMEKPENIQEQPREIYLKEQFFELILSGLKTAELRVAFGSFANIKAGDEIIFKSGGGKSVNVEITNIKEYQDLDEVLQSEDVSKIAPNMSAEQIQKIAPTIFSEADVTKYGLVLFEFVKIEQDNFNCRK